MKPPIKYSFIFNVNLYEECIENNSISYYEPPGKSNIQAIGEALK